MEIGKLTLGRVSEGILNSFDFLKVKDNRDYEGYRNAVDKFIDRYKLENDYKKLDKYLWLEIER